MLHFVSKNVFGMSVWCAHVALLLSNQKEGSVENITVLTRTKLSQPALNAVIKRALLSMA